MGVPRSRVERHLDLFLDVPRFKDYCPNGLQVEGSLRVSSVVSGVTASLALIRGAVRAGADTLLVHHGWFWRGEDPRILGPRRERLALVLAHRLNLFAYHLPLDVHPEVGNNSQLGARLGWGVAGRFGEVGLGCWHDFDEPRPLAAVAGALERRSFGSEVRNNGEKLVQLRMITRERQIAVIAKVRLLSGSARYPTRRSNCLR